MKKVLRRFVWLLPLLLAGCFHRTNLPKNPPAAPPIELPVPPTPVPPAPTQTTVTATPPAQEPAAETKPEEEDATPPVHHKKHPGKPAEDTTPEPAPAPPSAPTGVSAIGQLSSGDSGDLRQQTEDLIQSTERGLKAITRGLNSQEQKTAAQITEFLKQARSALGSGDVDGAHTLALKANVLLSELNE